jgi:hypothetical protein
VLACVTFVTFVTFVTCVTCIMKTILVDKIASITQALNLGHELRVATKDLPCDEGVVLVVEILSNKSTYNTLASQPSSRGSPIRLSFTVTR